MLNKFLLISFLIFTGCGTDTGNPGQNSTASGGDSVFTVIDYPGTDIIPNLLNNVCDKIHTCHNETIIRCNDSLSQITNIDTEIGINPETYETLGDIDEAFSKDELIEDPTSFNNCLLEITNLSCDSEAVSNAFDNSIDQPYSGVAKMLPKVCEKMISTPE